MFGAGWRDYDVENDEYRVGGQPRATRPPPPGIPPAAYREATLSESQHDDLDLASFPPLKRACGSVDVRWMVRVFGD